MRGLKRVTAYLLIWILVAITAPIEGLILFVIPIFIGLIPVWIAKIIFSEELLVLTWMIGLIEGIILYHYRNILPYSFSQLHEKLSPWKRIEDLCGKWLPD